MGHGVRAGRGGRGAPTSILAFRQAVHTAWLRRQPWPWGQYESFTLGRRITLEQVETIQIMAEKHGFRLDGFRSFERPVSAEHLAQVRQSAMVKIHRSG
jgi:hypothetical protein